jgi:hypothetical protein
MDQENRPDSTSSSQLPFELIPRLEPLLVLLFCLLSFGVYVPFWLLSRTLIINRLMPEKPIPINFVAICIASAVIFFYFIFTLPEGHSLKQILEEVGTGKHSSFVTAAIFYNLTTLGWGLLFCHRLNIFTHSQPGDGLHANYGMLVINQVLIVNIFYLQYKINQIIDSRRPGVM